LRSNAEGALDGGGPVLNDQMRGTFSFVADPAHAAVDRGIVHARRRWLASLPLRRGPVRATDRV
jgi:hypothetical protein